MSEISYNIYKSEVLTINRCKQEVCYAHSCNILKNYHLTNIELHKIILLYVGHTGTLKNTYDLWYVPPSSFITVVQGVFAHLH